jgi:hypothetical protein
MKVLYGCLLVAVLSACNNSTENTAPTDLDNTVNKDTTFVPKDSINNNTSTDSLTRDSSQHKQ